MKPQERKFSETSGYFNRIFYSIFPDPLLPKTDHERKRYLIKNLILHFRPATVPEKTLKFSLTWGLGGMAAFLIFLQLGTGLLLKFVYEPNPVSAYASILVIQNEVVFGQLIRNKRRRVKNPIPELAKAVGLTIHEWHDLELGRLNVRFSTLVNILDLLGIPLKAVFNTKKDDFFPFVGLAIGRDPADLAPEEADEIFQLYLELLEFRRIENLRIEGS